MGTTVKITGLENLSRRLKTEVGRALKKSQFEEDAVELLVDAIRKKGKLKALKTSTINRRRALATVNTTHQSFSPPKSNLTFSGQLLDSLDGKFIITKFSLVLTPKGMRKKYRNLTKRKRKKRRSKPVKNADVMEGQLDMGRDPLAVLENKKVRKDFVDLVKSVIRSKFDL